MPFELTIVTPDGERFAGPAESVVLPGSEGEFGVLEGHERFLAPLRAGAVEIRTADGTSWAAVSKGFADVSADSVTVLVETCELAEGIDVSRAEQARDRARAALGRLGEGASVEAERLRWQAKLAQAELRLEIALRLQVARH